MFKQSFRLNVPLAGFCMMLAIALPAAASPLQVTFVAYAIETDANGFERYSPVSVAAPGQLVEYRVLYENVSESALSALVINGDIPQPARFVPGSGLTPSNAELEAYVDGYGWSRVPVVRQTREPDGRITTVELPAHSYKAVRWKLSQSLHPGDSISALYRVRYDH